MNRRPVGIFLGTAISSLGVVWLMSRRTWYPTEPVVPPTASSDGWPGWVSPVSGQVGSGWQATRAYRHGKHEGIDFWASIGTPVKAVAAGKVTGAFLASDGNAGYMMTVDHGNGLTSRYLHLSSFIAKKGDYVAQGQTIALSGDSGSAKGIPHLHLDVRADSEAVKEYVARFGTPTSGFPLKSDGLFAVPAEALVPADYSAAVASAAATNGVVVYG